MTGSENKLRGICQSPCFSRAPQILLATWSHENAGSPSSGEMEPEILHFSQTADVAGPWTVFWVAKLLICYDASWDFCPQDPSTRLLPPSSYDRWSVDLTSGKITVNLHFEHLYKVLFRLLLKMQSSVAKDQLFGKAAVSITSCRCCRWLWNCF